MLLHGFPQTHLMWRHVAADLARDHMVIVPDLRGYGASDKPVEHDSEVCSKRTMAADVNDKDHFEVSQEEAEAVIKRRLRELAARGIG